MARPAPPNGGRPSIFVIGGPNGAGKTTSAIRLLPVELGLKRFVNADLIARGLSPLDPSATALRAGRLLLERIRELADRGESFAFESTLSSKSFLPFLSAQQERGFAIHVIYVWLESADLAVARVRERVLDGGHGIPEDVIRRRYFRGLTNFLRMYAPMADSWTLCDNSGEELLLVAQGGSGRTAEIHQAAAFARIKGSVETWPLKNRRWRR